MSHARKLTELDPSFRTLDHGDGKRCRALRFTCPACEDGDHQIVVPFIGDSPFSSGHVWSLHGPEDVECATLTPSIDATAGGACAFHGYVTNGMVTW